MASLTLRFRAVPHVHVPHPQAVRAGRHHMLGKAFREGEDGDDGTWHPHDEDDAVVLSGQHLSEDKAFLRRCVVEGELLCADEETAKALGVPWKPVAKTIAPRAKETV